MNQVKSIHYVDESRVAIKINSDPIFKRYVISVDGRMFEPFDFLKVIRSTKDGASGESLIAEVNIAMRTAVEMLKYQIKMVKTGGNKKGFIKSPKVLTKEQFDKLRARVEKVQHGGRGWGADLEQRAGFSGTCNNSLEMQLNQSKITLNRNQLHFRHL